MSRLGETTKSNFTVLTTSLISIGFMGASTPQNTLGRGLPYIFAITLLRPSSRGKPITRRIFTASQKKSKKNITRVISLASKLFRSRQVSMKSSASNSINSIRTKSILIRRVSSKLGRMGPISALKIRGSSHISTSAFPPLSSSLKIDTWKPGIQTGSKK